MFSGGYSKSAKRSRLKRTTLAALASVPLGPVLFLFLLVSIAHPWKAPRTVTCSLIVLGIPIWAALSSVLMLASVWREPRQKRMGLLSVALFPLSALVGALVILLESWTAESLLMGVAVPVFFVVGPVLVLVSLLRERDRTLRLTILVDAVLWAVCAAAVVRMW